MITAFLLDFLNYNSAVHLRDCCCIIYFLHIARRGSVKNFVALVKNGSFLVRIIDMTILIEKEFIYGSSKRPNPTDYYRK